LRPPSLHLVWQSIPASSLYSPGLLMRTLLVLAIIFLLLAVTSPSPNQHRAAIRTELRGLVEQRHPIASTVATKLGGLVGLDPVAMAVDQAMRDVHCRSYIIASVCDRQGSMISIGLATRVWTGMELVGPRTPSSPDGDSPGADVEVIPRDFSGISK